MWFSTTLTILITYVTKNKFPSYIVHVYVNNGKQLKQNWYHMKNETLKKGFR